MTKIKKDTDNLYVFIDTETGGTNPSKHSLLSVGVVIWNKNKGIISKKEFILKHDKYCVTAKARQINKFDEAYYNENGIDEKKFINDFLEYLYIYFERTVAIPIVGHNVQFDVNFLKVVFKKNNRSFYQYFSHRIIDTYSVYKTCVLAGLIEVNINSSTEAFRYFNIKVNGRHSALGDAMATIVLYEKLIDLIKNKMFKN